jgi:GNAT superfamily N-acetyltransferase
MGPLPVIEIRAVAYDDPDAQKLVSAALTELGERYGGSGDDTPVDAADFRPPAGDFLLAYVDGVASGCAGWRRHGPDAELKRMFTDPRVRGRGLARRLLTAIEESARAAGLARVILETGDKQPEAVALYTACGYARIPDFGYYKDHAGVLSFGRDL